MQMLMNFLKTIDSFLPEIFGGGANPILDSVMVFLTKLGDGGVFWIALILVMLAIPKYRKLGVACAISLAVCFFTGNYIIKPLVGRPRPCSVYPELQMLIPRPSDFSFPSMHTATAFSVSGLILFRNKAFGICLIILSVLIALSRVYLNVHYTTDIIAGAVYGILCAYITKIVIKKTKFGDISY